MSAQIPFSFISTSTGDLDLSKGLQQTTTMAQYVAQRLRQNLSFFLGEWFLDRRQGLPYWKRIIAQRYDQALIEQIFRKACEATIGVARVARIQVAFNRRTRVLSIPSLIVICNDGSKITQDDLGRPFIINLVSAVQTAGAA